VYVIPNSDDPHLSEGDEEAFEATVREISRELGESVMARGVTSIEYTTYTDAEGRRAFFEFRTVGSPKGAEADFQRVLAMRFVQVLWERHGRRCLPVGLSSEDERFMPWSGGRPDFILARKLADGMDALPPGLAADVGPNDPCPCGSGRRFKDCCKR
jgi:hypothetical protein